MVSHPCPIHSCRAAEVADHRLMCISHWYLVPEALRKTITFLWNNGKPREGYAEARRNAIEQVERRLSARAPSTGNLFGESA